MPRLQHVQEFVPSDRYIEISSGDIAGPCTFQVLTGQVYLRVSSGDTPAPDALGIVLSAGFGWVAKSLDEIIPSSGHTRIWVRSTEYPTTVFIDHA